MADEQEPQAAAPDAPQAEAPAQPETAGVEQAADRRSGDEVVAAEWAAMIEGNSGLQTEKVGAERVLNQDEI
ncbi:MAG: hypothetical protein WD207_05270, partial [Xanthobacteraceae bacterium]